VTARCEECGDTCDASWTAGDPTVAILCERCYRRYVAELIKLRWEQDDKKLRAR
jgi:NMD protein affecting ribosome stability and mRNA decay